MTENRSASVPLVFILVTLLCEIQYYYILEDKSQKLIDSEKHEDTSSVSRTLKMIAAENFLDTKFRERTSKSTQFFVLFKISSCIRPKFIYKFLNEKRSIFFVIELVLHCGE